jgi:hypothetical protein
MLATKEKALPSTHPPYPSPPPPPKRGPLLKKVRKNLPGIFEAVVIIVLVKKNCRKKTMIREHHLAMTWKNVNTPKSRLK